MALTCNIFADLRPENADELLLKAEIVSDIARAMKQKKLTQAKATSPHLPQPAKLPIP